MRSLLCSVSWQEPAVLTHIPSLSHLCKACVSQNTPFPSLPFLRRAKLPVAASQAAPTPLPASPGRQQPPLAWAEGPELPETPAIQMKDTKEKRNKGRKTFLAGTQLSDSELGKKVRTAVCSRAAECPLHSMQPESCEHFSLLLPSGCTHRCGLWDTCSAHSNKGQLPSPVLTVGARQGLSCEVWSSTALHIRSVQGQVRTSLLSA